MKMEKKIEGQYFNSTALFAGTVEYPNCTSAPNKCPTYDTKPFDNEAPVLEL